MLTMRDHGVEDYTALRHMDTTDVGVLGDDDRACLEELGQYLVAADAWHRFGIWLLHKHFEPRPGEVFVERAIRATRTTQTAPAAAERDLTATAIRFDCRADAQLVGMEFAGPADFGEVAPLSAQDEAVLAGIADRLLARDKIDRFGVRLIRNPLGMSESELLHETCDSANRTLHCSVAERDAVVADDKVVETAWRWRPVPNGTSQPAVMGECTAGCRTVGEGHDIAHTHSEPDDFGND